MYLKQALWKKNKNNHNIIMASCDQTCHVTKTVIMWPEMSCDKNVIVWPEWGNVIQITTGSLSYAFLILHKCGHQNVLLDFNFKWKYEWVEQDFLPHLAESFSNIFIWNMFLIFHLINALKITMSNMFLSLNFPFLSIISTQQQIITINM